MATINWRTGVSGDWGNAALWTGGTVPNAAATDAAIAASGSYTVSIAGGESFTARNVTLDDSGAVLTDSGVLHLTGTLQVAAGRVAIQRGTIQGGTIAGDGTELAFDFEPLNTLDGVTVKGGLILGGNAVFTNGTKVVAADGVSPGLLTLGPVQGVILELIGTQTLHNTITLENYSQIAAGSFTTQATTLTLAADTRVSGDGTVGGLNADALASLVNQGAITANVAGQSLDLGATTVTNTGSLGATNGATLRIDQGLINTGSITTNGGRLEIDGAFNNAGGTIVSTGTEIDLGNVATAELGSIQRSGGALYIGNVDNRGQTLDLLAGPLAGFTLRGTILGGRITNPASLNLTFQYSAALDGVSVVGPLTLNGGGLRLADGTSVSSADGSGPGVITDNGQTLILQGTQTFHGTINLSGANAVLGAGAYAVGMQPGTDTLTLASDARVIGAGTMRDTFFLYEMAGQGVFIGPATIVNEGSIIAGVAGQTLSITADTFTNTGFSGIGSLQGATLTVAPTHFTNLAAGTLDGGYIFASGLVQLKSDGVLTTIGGSDRTDVQIDRQGQLVSWNAATASYQAFQDTLTTIGAHGNLSLAADTTFTHALTNDGTLTQYDGMHTITAPSLTNAAGASFLLWGTLDARLQNDGLVQAVDTSRITGAVTGSGELDISTVATLELAKVDTQTIKFAGAYGTLKLDSPGTYTGELMGFTNHDTIDLAGIKSNHARYSDGVLTLYHGRHVVDRLNLQGPFTGENFVLQSDGAGGTLVQVNAPPVTTVPGTQTVTAKTATALHGFSVADADARFPDETFTVRLTDFLGQLSATPGAGQARVTGDNTHHLTLMGSLFDVNTALSSLTYDGPHAGTDLIRTYTSDGRGGVGRECVAVTIAPPHSATS